MAPRVVFAIRILFTVLYTVLAIAVHVFYDVANVNNDNNNNKKFSYRRDSARCG